MGPIWCVVTCRSIEGVPRPQRRGGREAAEAAEAGGGGDGVGGDGEEDLVVDEQPAMHRSDLRQQELSSDKLLSLEQAVLTSIDRCRGCSDYNKQILRAL